MHLFWVDWLAVNRLGGWKMKPIRNTIYECWWVSLLGRYESGEWGHEWGHNIVWCHDILNVFYQTAYECAGNDFYADSFDSSKRQLCLEGCFPEVRAYFHMISHSWMRSLWVFKLTTDKVIFKGGYQSVDRTPRGVVSLPLHMEGLPWGTSRIILILPWFPRRLACSRASVPFFLRWY